MRAHSVQAACYLQENIQTPFNPEEYQLNPAPFIKILTAVGRTIERATKFSIGEMIQIPFAFDDSFEFIPEICNLPDSFSYFDLDMGEFGMSVAVAAFQYEPFSETSDREDLTINVENGCTFRKKWTAFILYRRGRQNPWELTPTPVDCGIHSTKGAGFWVSGLSKADPNIPEDAFRASQNIGLMAARGVLLFLHMLSCKNVTEHTVRPEPGLVKARKKAGKIPPYSYHVIKLPETREHYASEFRGLTRESPRLHFRRGHIRHLSSGELTWVSQCVVGDVRKGVVEKHYEAQI